MVIATVDVSDLPALCTKKEVAKWLNTSTRNVELQVAANKFPKPIRLGRHPRWRKSDLFRWMEDQRPEAEAPAE